MEVTIFGRTKLDVTTPIRWMMLTYTSDPLGSVKYINASIERVSSPPARIGIRLRTQGFSRARGRSAGQHRCGLSCFRDQSPCQSSLLYGGPSTRRTVRLLRHRLFRHPQDCAPDVPSHLKTGSTGPTAQRGAILARPRLCFARAYGREGGIPLEEEPGSH